MGKEFKKDMGKLIVIEGLDGSGKSTQIECLASRLAGNNTPFRQVKFPCYALDSSAPVRMYLNGELGELCDVNPYGGSAFYTVDRYASFLSDWGKDYNSDKIILCDRYTTSNIPHQMSRLPQSEWDSYLLWLKDLEYSKIGLPVPSVVVYLDMPPEVSRKLLEKRCADNNQQMDIHEKDLDYLFSCRTAALYAAERENWHVISCCDGDRMLSVLEMEQLVLEKVREFI